MPDIGVRSTHREQLIDVSREVAGIVAASGILEGAAVVYCPHTTAGVTVNENADPDVAADMLQVLSGLVPCDPAYRHCEGNSDAHVKASMMGASVTVPISAGSLALGKWQGVFFCEFDGPRNRTLRVQVLGR